MGNKLSCCWKPNASPKQGRHSGPEIQGVDESDVYVAGARNSVAVPPSTAVLELVEFDFLDFEAGQPVLRMSDLKIPAESDLELIPSDHPRASTIFLKKSQMDLGGKCKKNYSYHVSPALLRGKHSSCSTIFLDESTMSEPSLKITLQSLALAIYYHIKNRDANRSRDIFEEELHPFTEEMVPEEYFHHNPDPESIYIFLCPFFTAFSLTGEFAVTALVYLERLVIYAEIDIGPTNWKRVVLGAILLAFKYLDDLAIWNVDYCKIIKGITLKDLNALERQYIYLLQFNLYVSASVYAKYYFDLRSLASNYGLPVVFAPLRKERAQKLEELTGKLPLEYPLDLAEEPPIVRRRIGTTFKLDEQKILPKGEENCPGNFSPLLGRYNFYEETPTLEAELERLEQEFAVQSQIMEAARHLTSDPSVSKKLKKQWKTSYLNALKKLQEIENAINENHIKSGKKPTQRASLIIDDGNIGSEDISLSDALVLEDVPGSNVKGSGFQQPDISAPGDLLIFIRVNQTST